MKSPKISFFPIFLFFILIFHINTYANSFFSTLSQSITTIPKDLETITLYPFNNPDKILQFTALTAGLTAIDHPTTQFVQNNLDPFFEWNWYNFDNIEYLSGQEEALVIGLAGLYGTGILFDDPKSQATVYLSLKAFAYSMLYSHIILKTSFGRLRPDPNLSRTNSAPYPFSQNPLSFGNFHPPQILADSYGTSFPSFHFTLFFSCAKVWQRLYNNYPVPYALCFLALAPDFSSHRHWVSDMVAGALIGTMIGDTIADNYFGINPEKKLSSAPTITPLLSLNQFGLEISIP